MKILALTSSYPRFEGDPTAPFIESITKQIAALGHEVHLVLPENTEWNRPPIEDSVHYHLCRYSPVRSSTPWGYSAALEEGVRIRRRLYALAPLVSLSAYRTCQSLARRGRFDLVHAHWVIPNGPVAARVAARNRLPLVVSLHGSDVSVAQRSPWMGRVARRVFRRADAVTAPSTDLLDRAQGLGASGALELIPYGADPEVFRFDPLQAERIRSRLALESTDVAVLGIGRFVRWKGFDDLIEAVDRVRDKCPSVRLVLVGGGDLNEELAENVRRRGLEGRVTFAGMASREEVPAYLAAADIVAVPSIHYAGYVDGLPNVALEAMAAGKPLIATRVGGLPEIVRDGESGVLVDERDPGGLAGAIGELASDPALREAMGEHARALVETRLNWESVADRFVEVFGRAAKRREAQSS